MNDHSNNGAPISGWEDDGGAQQSGTAGRPGQSSTAGRKRPAEQERLDASHDSDARGEHRYDDLQQTATEQEARQQRDELKQRLARHATRRR